MAISWNSLYNSALSKAVSWNIAFNSATPKAISWNSLFNSAPPTASHATVSLIQYRQWQPNEKFRLIQHCLLQCQCCHESLFFSLPPITISWNSLFNWAPLIGISWNILFNSAPLIAISWNSLFNSAPLIAISWNSLYNSAPPLIISWEIPFNSSLAYGPVSDVTTAIYGTVVVAPSVWGTPTMTWSRREGCPPSAHPAHSTTSPRSII